MGGPPPVPSAVPPKKKDDTKGLLGLLFLVAAGALIYFAWQEGSVRTDALGTGREPAARHDIKQIETMVNRHLIMTNKQIELQQEKARLENHSSLPAVGERILPRGRPNYNKGVDLSPDRNEMNAARDLEQVKELNLASPHVEIQSEIADREAQAQYEEMYRREYARQFIENARAGGYEVQLDANFTVLSVKKINKNEEAMRLFETKSKAAH